MVREIDYTDIAKLFPDLTPLKAPHTSIYFAGGTFTIINLGMYEIEQFLPIINVLTSVLGRSKFCG